MTSTEMHLQISERGNSCREGRKKSVFDLIKPKVNLINDIFGQICMY